MSSVLDTLINGGGSSVTTKDLLNDQSKPISNTDYFDIVITDLKPDTEYKIQLAWVYPDDSRSDYSSTYTFTTDPESAPDIPSQPSVTAGPGFINVTWNGNKAGGGALQEYAKVNIYVDGVERDFFLSAGTKSIALAKGTYAITLRSASSTNIISNATSPAVSVTVATDATDAASALTAAQQAALDAGIAQSTANGKNKVTYSTNAPGSTANTIGDIWYQYGTSGPNNGRIIAQFSGAGGTSWTQTTISGLVVANLDAGSITTGTLSVGIEISGANGSFEIDAVTGDIFSNTGKIGGWNINANEIYSNYITLNSADFAPGGSGSITFHGGSDYAMYAFGGFFEIKDMSYNTSVIFANTNDIIIGSGTSRKARLSTGASYAYNSFGLRNIKSSTVDPSDSTDGNDGDVWLKYI